MNSRAAPVVGSPSSSSTVAARGPHPRFDKPAALRLDCCSRASRGSPLTHARTHARHPATELPATAGGSCVAAPIAHWCVCTRCSEGAPLRHHCARLASVRMPARRAAHTSHTHSCEAAERTGVGAPPRRHHSRPSMRVAVQRRQMGVSVRSCLGCGRGVVCCVHSQSVCVCVRARFVIQLRQWPTAQMSRLVGREGSRLGAAGHRRDGRVQIGAEPLPRAVGEFAGGGTSVLQVTRAGTIARTTIIGIWVWRRGARVGRCDRISHSAVCCCSGRADWRGACWRRRGHTHWCH